MLLRNTLLSTTWAPPYKLNKGSPSLTKSPTWGTSSMTPLERTALAKRIVQTDGQDNLRRPSVFNDPIRNTWRA